MSDVITIGIAGGTGSGKTTITRRILDEFGGDVSVLYHDNYYKRHDDIPFPERKKLNYDHPNAFDTPLLVQHLDALRAGQAIECPIYDYTVHNQPRSRDDHGHAGQGHRRRGHPHLCRAGAARPAGHQALCRHGRRCAHPAAHRARRARPRPRPGVDRHAISDHGQAHARDVRRAVEALCRYHYPRRRA